MKKVFLLLILNSAIITIEAQTYNSFMDIEFGLSYTDFVNQNPDAVSFTEGFNQFDWSWYSEISRFEMDCYYVSKTNSNNINLGVYCFFYNDKLAMICVNYGCHLFDKNYPTLDDMIKKYGQYTNKKVIYPNDSGDKTTSVYWKKNCCILNYITNSNLNCISLVFADKPIQDKLNEIKKQKNLNPSDY